jgi:hypothetical protein
MPIADDFSGSTAYKLFSDGHYLQILNGLGLFDREAIAQEYDAMHHAVKELADNHIRETRTFQKMAPTVGHKQFISYIRSLARS